MFTTLVLSLCFSFHSLTNALPLAARHSNGTGAAAYCSDESGNYKLSPITAPVMVKNSSSVGWNSSSTQASNSSSTWKLTINDTPSGYKQKITGFGAEITDATVESFNTLSSDQLESLLNTMFRHTIGASDLSADPAYTYDDNNGKADPSLSSFGLGDRGTAMAKMLAQMETINEDLMILGSSWSAYPDGQKTPWGLRQP